METEDNAVVEPSTTEPETRPTITFVGNNYDLMSVAGVSVAGATLFACGTCGLGFYCLPLVPVILGAIGLLSLKDAVDADRTKLFSWISIGVGALFLLMVLALVLFYIVYFLFIFVVIAAEGGGY